MEAIAPGDTPDDLSAAHRVALLHQRMHRLVGGFDAVGVHDCDIGYPSNRPDVADRAVACGSNLGPRNGAHIDAPVTPHPIFRGLVKWFDDPGGVFQTSGGGDVGLGKWSKGEQGDEKTFHGRYDFSSRGGVWPPCS